MSIIDYTTFDLNSITYSKPVKTDTGYYQSSAYILINDIKTPIQLRLSCLTTTTGIMHKTNSNYIEFVFDKTSADLYTFLINLDKHNIKTAFENSSEWFNNKFPLDIIADFYKSNIKLPRQSAPPTIKIKLAQLQELEKRMITIDNIEDKKLDILLQFNGLRFLRQQFTIEWDLLQLAIADIPKTDELAIVNQLTDNVVDEEIPDKLLASISLSDSTSKTIEPPVIYTINNNAGDDVEQKDLVRKTQRRARNREKHNTILNIKKELTAKLILEARRAEKLALLKKTKAVKAANELKQLESTNYMSDESNIDSLTM